MQETAPQFIWRHLCQTPDMAVTTSATGRVIQYRPPPFVDVPDERCWLCGGLTHGRGRLVADAVDEMFSDTQFARCPTSGSLCEGCAGLKAQRPLRNYSLLAASGVLSHPSRPDWRHILTSPPEPPWAGCLAVSGQKHLFFRTRIVKSSDSVVVVLEDQLVAVDVPALARLLHTIELLLAVFSKAEIESGRYSQGRISQYGLGAWRDADRELRWARQRNLPLFALALFVAQIPERKEVKSDVRKTAPAACVDGRGSKPCRGATSAGPRLAQDRQGDRKRRQHGQISLELPL